MRASQSERRHKELPTAASLLTDTQSPQCCFCQQNHPSQNCQAVTGINSRREVLRKTGRCYICLRKGHVSHSCHSRIECLNCRGRHHVAICSVAARPKTEEPGATGPVPNLTRQVDGMFKPQPTNPKQATCGPTLGSKSFYRPHRLLPLIRTVQL